VAFLKALEKNQGISKLKFITYAFTLEMMREKKNVLCVGSAPERLALCRQEMGPSSEP